MINFREALEEIAEAIDGKTLDMIGMAKENDDDNKKVISYQDHIILCQKDRIFGLVDTVNDLEIDINNLKQELADRVNHVCGDCVREG